MSEFNQLTKSTERNVTQKRAATLAVAILMAFCISLTLTIKARAVEQLVITVSDAGMTPTSASASGGIVHLKIENSSARDSITLRVSGESGAVVRVIVLPEGVRELNTELEIVAGQYVLTEASNTAWACALTVQ